MAQIKSTYDEVRVPFTKMSFTPDIPSTNLGPNEYNDGLNIETDVRGIRSVFGDVQILNQLSGTPVYITGGYREDGNWYYIVACVENTNEGRWYQVNFTSGVVNITPGVGLNPTAFLPGYSTDINITEAWNGTALVINDAVNVPMFLQGNSTEFEQYKLQADENIINLTWVLGTATVDIAAAPIVPYQLGDKITISNAFPITWNGDYVITLVNSSTSFDFQIASNPGLWNNGGTLRPTYQWNYNPDWENLICGFMRVFSAPNVGSVLIAGNLTADDGTTIYNFPNTVRWSQNFGLNTVPQTWQPSITNVANELEVPLRGPVLDGFPCNGNFFVSSYWDTVVFSPIAYQTTQIPVFGVRLFNQGRGLLNSNCWVNTDDLVYGVDARDIWVFNGQDFKPLGNQRVKNYFFYNLDPTATNQVFMEINSQKNQIELYYPEDGTSTGFCNRMISYRYDLDTFNPPRVMPNIIMSTEGPVFRSDYGNIFDPGSRTVSFVRAVANTYICEKDQGYSFLANANINSSFRRDAIHLSDEYSTQTMVHRILPEVNNINEFGLTTTSTGNISIQIGGQDSPGQPITFKNTVVYPIVSGNTWIQVNQNVYRLNTIIISNSSNSNAWQCSAITWQYTETQDAR